MGKFNRIIHALLGGGLLIACAQPVERVADIEAPRPQQPTSASQPAAVDPRFDAQGRLKPSGQRFSWLELPSGFKRRAGSTDKDASFEALDMPVRKVREYLEARTIPGSIVYRTDGTMFRDVRPTHTQLTMPPMHVTVLETNRARHEIRLLLEDLTPPKTPPLAVESAARELERMRSRMQ